jgi:hypothetical protein
MIVSISIGTSVSFTRTSSSSWETLIFRWTPSTVRVGNTFSTSCNLHTKSRISHDTIMRTIIDSRFSFIDFSSFLNSFYSRNNFIIITQRFNMNGISQFNSFIFIFNNLVMRDIFSESG